MNRLAIAFAFIVACGGGEPASKPAAAAAAPPAAAPAAAAPAAAAPVAAPKPTMLPEPQLAGLTTGWTIENKATGDLNQDGVPDAAAILSKQQGDETVATLKVWLADATGKLGPEIEAKNAVCAGCGGAKGGPVPFELAINDKRVLSLEYFGGSRETSSLTTKWRFQEGKFALIGVVATQADTIPNELGKVGAITREANISTGKMTESIDVISGKPPSEDAMPPMKTTKTECPVKGVSPDLTAFDFNAYEPPACSKAVVGEAP